MRVIRISSDVLSCPRCAPKRRTEDTNMRHSTRRSPVLASTIVALSLAASAVLAGLALADEPRGFLETVHKHLTLTTTVPDNGDQNPYAIVVAPVSAGKVQQDDVLIDNFNDLSNL